MEQVAGKIFHYQMITPQVLELVLEVPQIFPFIPGQWILLGYQDGQGSFKRAYSIVNHEIKNEKMYITLCIKLLENGRGSTILKNKKIWDAIEVNGINGHFKLQDTDVPKVFIGTGTGLVPVYAMAKSSSAKDKTLIFSVPYKSELFYEENIKNIPDLKHEIYITREEVSPSRTSPGYHFWRFDLSKFTFAPETEFYLCGNPDMVKANVEKLRSLWFTHIFSEQF
jgi:ferredoxin-NADP reductase